MRAGAVLAAVAAAGGCGAGAARSPAGPATLTLAGARFTVSPAPRPGAPGALAVARAGAPLHDSDGALAFRVAAARCGQAGLRLAGTVDDSHRPDGTWLLRGGCA